ncbi:PREDICTED: uncharacterized protein LOC109239321 [Nicotiana attenuata]|uniref:uncharacterized protein LOC109239321 n=1 Tax=Nicotiana attenuata TaxID=49451 RepID=UPI00090498C4|nr:PREDICTED: uncharacterized protein LOC109239321 [Nicotiana attenuata]
MPASCTISASTGGIFLFGDITMAIYEMENGHCWSLTTRSRASSKVITLLEGLKIKQIISSSYYPNANGQAESTNKIIIQNLKKKLEDAKGNWPDELPCMLWAYRAKAKSSTGEIPFSLVYGAEALIPLEIGETNIRYSRANEEANNEPLLIKLDFLEEYQNLAYRKVTQSTREVNAGKLGPMWERPYRISAIIGKGSYQLENQVELNCQAIGM